MFYTFTPRRETHSGEFKADMATLFELLKQNAIYPVVVDRLPLSAARKVHARINAGGIGGKIVLLPGSRHKTAAASARAHLSAA